MLLCLRHRLAAVALNQPLAWELPSAVVAALKKKKKKKKKKVLISPHPQANRIKEILGDYSDDLPKLK